MSFGKSKDDSERLGTPTGFTGGGYTGGANPSYASSTGSGGATSLTGQGTFGQGAPGQPQLEAFLGKGSKVTGSLAFSGPADLDGTVEGEVTARERLTIGESAVINAKISGAEIIVKGTVNGDIVANKRLSLKKPARVTGNLTATNLSIEEGVIFEGKCIMTTGASSTSSTVDLKVATTRIGAA